MNNFNIYREKKPFLVGDEANRHLIETKLVDILEDFKLENRDRLFLKEYTTEGKLTLLGVNRNEEVPEEAEQNEDPTNWTVTPYDLGGHTSYFNSQKLFTCGSSVFFLAFQR